jgi:myosin heavy subunit
MREIITTSLTSELALYGRDGLLKFVYEKMFSWIVGLINRALGIYLKRILQFSVV